MRSPRLLATLSGIVLAIVASAGAGDLAADKKRPPISRCIKYSQKKGADQQSVAVGLKNRCGYDVSCTVEWSVSCEDDDDQTARRNETRSLDLDRGDAEIIRASAAMCGDGDWAVDDIRWSCDPR